MALPGRRAELVRGELRSAPPARLRSHPVPSAVCVSDPWWGLPCPPPLGGGSYGPSPLRAQTQGFTQRPPGAEGKGRICPAAQTAGGRSAPASSPSVCAHKGPSQSVWGAGGSSLCWLPVAGPEPRPAAGAGMARWIKVVSG